MESAADCLERLSFRRDLGDRPVRRRPASHEIVAKLHLSYVTERFGTVSEDMIPLDFRLFAALETRELRESQFRYRQALHSYVLACYVGNAEIAAALQAELREILAGAGPQGGGIGALPNCYEA